MTETVTYIAGAELADLRATWLDDRGRPHDDFESGWTFKLRIGRPGRPALLEKTTGIVGANTAPNIIVSWAVGELDVVPDGHHTIEYTATRIVDGKERKVQGPFEMERAIGAPV